MFCLSGSRMNNRWFYSWQGLWMWAQPRGSNSCMANIAAFVFNQTFRDTAGIYDFVWLLSDCESWKEIWITWNKTFQVETSVMYLAQCFFFSLVVASTMISTAVLSFNFIVYGVRHSTMKSYAFVRWRMSGLGVQSYFERFLQVVGRLRLDISRIY